MAGVAIDTVEDMKVLFQDIPPRCNVCIDDDERSCNTHHGILHRYRQRTGVDESLLTGTIQNDISRNLWCGILTSIRRLKVCVLYPTSLPIPPEICRVSTAYPYQATTCTKQVPPADIELAYTLADGIEYVKAGLAAGLDIDTFAGRFSFFWGIGMNFLMEIAKLRAGRLLWAELLQPFGCKKKNTGTENALSNIRL